MGRYVLRSEIGRGGMGVVYRAHDKTLGRDVALKVLSAAASVGEETIERFQREARAAAALDHPNIIRVLDVGRLPGPQAGTPAPYYTMELLHGEDLSQGMAAGRIGPREGVEAVRQVSLALFYAHQKGILHRDIKPQNIFLRHQATAVASDTPTLMASDARKEVHALLLDFGLAKLSERDLASHAVGSSAGKSVQTLTRSGEIFGTPAYMAPEQTRGAHEVDARADVYSLGATLYHALTGDPPFKAATLAELLEKVHRADPLPPSRMNAESDADLDTLTLRCLQKEPKDRYQTAGDLAEDCRRWLAGEPIVARPVGLVGRLWRKAKRNKAVAIPVAALSFVLLAGLAIWGGIVLRDHVKVRNSISKTESWFERDHTAQASQAEGWAGRDHTAEATELETWFGQNHVAEPLDAIKEAQILAPDDRKVKRLVARIYVTQGRVAYAVYRVRREEARDLEAKETAAQVSEAGEEKKVPSLEERRNAMDETWGRADVLREARFKRGGAWSASVSAFTDALKHVDDEPEAMRTLAELYWDEYRSAEVERRPWDAQRLEPLVTKYGGKELQERVRGVREVRVRFQLPTAFAASCVKAYLFEYRPCEKPPVLTLVPFDVEHGRALRDRVSTLAADRSEWEPVPLDALKSDRAGNPANPTAGRVDKVRWGSIYPLEKQEANHVRITPTSGVASWSVHLPKGSYLLWIPAGQGLYETRYPFEVARDYEWGEVCELPVEDVIPPMPPAMEAGPGARAYWTYTPPGPYRASGDPGAQQSPPRPAAVLRVPEGKPLDEVKEPRAEGCWMARFKVTCGMYLEYLNDREWHKHCDPPCGDWGHVPRKAQDALEQTAYWPRNASGRFSVAQGWDEWPILAISWNDGADYCRWLTARLRSPRAAAENWVFELATEDEWERADRGPDGRFFPWGDTFHSSFCRMNESRPEIDPMNPEPCGLFPLDEGPFGARDLAGEMEEMTSTLAGSHKQWRIFKGGAWSAPAAICRAAYRLGNSPGYVDTFYGFRVVARKAPPPR